MTPRRACRWGDPAVLRRLAKYYAPGNELLATCWLWGGAKNEKGYGVFHDGDRQVRAHRFIWEVANRQDVPPGLLVLHDCDNPSCVRPSHLKLGTVTDNNREAFEKGRQMVGEKFWAAKTTWDVVAQIRAEYRKPFTRQDEYRRLATKYGLGVSAVRKIVQNKTWTRLPRRRRGR